MREFQKRSGRRDGDDGRHGGWAGPPLHCLTESQFPRRLMELVIDPGFDYHWYRHHRGGFWGHKPGHTAARNVDNSGVVITDPETCDRDGYTDFCGNFYAGRSVVIN